MLFSRHLSLRLVLGLSVVVTGSHLVFANCPFCTAVRPSFAERRAEATAVVVGSTVKIEPAAGADAPRTATFAVAQVLKGRETLEDPTRVTTAVDAGVNPGDTVLLLGTQVDSKWTWEVVPVDETTLAYFARFPDVKRPWSERLRYAAKFFEHDAPAIADDVYREFGRAPFEEVAAVAEAFDFADVRRRLVAADVPDERKGFFGLLLGLATEPEERSRNVALLRKSATAPASEFRAGYDGILGGLLWAEGEQALDEIDARLLRNPNAAEGDVRHAQTALRFYQQYGRRIPAERMQRSVAYLLDRPATAPGALQDFTRRREWDYLERAEKLFLASPGDDPSLDRAVVGYLLLCPNPAGAEAVRRLRAAAPERTQEAERFLSLLGVRGES